MGRVLSTEEGKGGMTELTEWLLEQITEDERRANLALHGPWLAIHGKILVESVSEHRRVHVDASAADIEHIVTWCPKRALAECDAKRLIIERHVPRLVMPGVPICGHCSVPDAVDWPCADVRDVTSVYAGRAGYREQWRPVTVAHDPASPRA